MSGAYEHILCDVQLETHEGHLKRESGALHLIGAVVPGPKHLGPFLRHHRRVVVSHPDKLPRPRVQRLESVDVVRIGSRLARLRSNAFEDAVRRSGWDDACEAQPCGSEQGPELGLGTNPAPWLVEQHQNVERLARAGIVRRAHEHLHHERLPTIRHGSRAVAKDRRCVLVLLRQRNDEAGRG